ncbi:hypothetical protein PIB30_058013 [Stylosanthes scabra]|uniref:Uncharacterized protein n=1 Tax=Stylosanthes scabra TaxID=79078 RepID=A0ABU6QK96_9FABA|nr:hypothetical protein [Stylosanthes scabra]
MPSFPLPLPLPSNAVPTWTAPLLPNPLLTNHPPSLKNQAPFFPFTLATPNVAPTRSQRGTTAPSLTQNRILLPPNLANQSPPPLTLQRSPNVDCTIPTPIIPCLAHPTPLPSQTWVQHETLNPSLTQTELTLTHTCTSFIPSCLDRLELEWKLLRKAKGARKSLRNAWKSIQGTDAYAQAPDAYAHTTGMAYKPSFLTGPCAYVSDAYAPMCGQHSILKGKKGISSPLETYIKEGCCNTRDDALRAHH